MAPSMRQGTLCHSEKEGIKERVIGGEIQIVNAIAFFEVKFRKSSPR